jgi:hypothetical protein
MRIGAFSTSRSSYLREYLADGDLDIRESLGRNRVRRRELKLADVARCSGLAIDHDTLALDIDYPVPGRPRLLAIAGAVSFAYNTATIVTSARAIMRIETGQVAP